MPTLKELEALSFLYALIELLSEQDFISIEELYERKRIVGKGLKDTQGKSFVATLPDCPQRRRLLLPFRLHDAGLRHLRTPPCSLL